MNQSLRTLLAASAVTATLLAAPATLAQTVTTTATATASGWGNTGGGGLYSPSGSGTGDYRTGIEGGETYVSFLTFTVPASAVSYTAATLRLHSGGVPQGPNALEVRQVTLDPATNPTSLPANVSGAATYGTLAGITAGQIIEVTLNPAGLAAVNAARGSAITFGFVNTTADPGTDLIFEFSPTTPRELVLAAPAPAVPTLSEWALLGFGIILAGSAVLYIQRRRLTA